MTYTITLPGKPQLYNPAPLPAGWETVGEILREGESIPGALIRNANTGMYAQANAGSIRTLDQAEVAYALVRTVGNYDPDYDVLLTANEAGEMLGLTYQTIKYWVTRGYLQPVPSTRPAKYRKSELLAARDRDVKLGRPRAASSAMQLANMEQDKKMQHISSARQLAEEQDKKERS